MTRSRHAPLASALVAAIALTSATCETSSPNAPSPQTFVVSGQVSMPMNGGTTPVPGARVEIVSGTTVSARADTDASGRYRLDGIRAGTYLIRASAAGMLPDLENVTLDADRVIDFTVVPAAVFTLARVVDLFTAEPIADASVSGGVVPTTSDGDGRFQAVVQPGLEGDRELTIGHSRIVTRVTRITVPGPEVEYRVLPLTFPIDAFDQLCRHPGLLRWVTPPRLIIIASLLNFTTAGEEFYDAAGTGYTDDDLPELQATLTAALQAFSGETFQAFADIRVERPPAGARVQFLNDDAITVARFAGLTPQSGSAGFGRWRGDETGGVTGGAVLLDWQQDAIAAFQAHLRGHELGHAMGYGHVTAAPSIMTQGAGLPIMPFDRQAGIVAFSRAVGNLSPDTDPLPAAAADRAGPPRWSAAIW